MQEYLTVSEAARLLGVSTDAVTAWADQGKLPVALRVGRQGWRVFRRADVEALAQQLRQEEGESHA